MAKTDDAHQELVNRLEALDQALGDHSQWMSRLNRQLICATPQEAADLAEDASLRCNFAQWLQGPGKPVLRDEQDYQAILLVHQSMHDIARHLLGNKAKAEPIVAEDYDALIAIAARFRQLLRQAEQRFMERMGAVDKLTGVWNRQAVHLRLSEEIERSQRGGQPCALCHIDLDDFAKVNEAYGQKIGDLAIQAVAAFIKPRLRAYDTLFRVGGEEFLLCLPNTSLDQAATMINRLREDLARQDFNLDDQRVRVTASIGVVALDPVFFIDETLEQVERAQLIAKRKGGNGVCVWREGAQAAGLTVEAE